MGRARRKPVTVWWRWKVLEACADGRNRANSGVALTLSGGRRIEVGRGFDAHTLMQLLGVLEQA